MVSNQILTQFLVLVATKMRYVENNFVETKPKIGFIESTQSSGSKLSIPKANYVSGNPRIIPAVDARLTVSSLCSEKIDKTNPI